MKRDSQFPYEDAAETATVTGWACKTCRRFWGADERMARWCCANSMACECGGRIDASGWSICEACREKRDNERWAACEVVEWDGETPLCVFDDDTYFWSPEDVEGWLEGYVDDDDPPRRFEDMRLVLCEPVKHREFEVSDFLSDDLHEDDRFDEAEINKTVNDWIKANVGPSWTPTMKRVSPESLRKYLHESYWTTRGEVLP